MPDQPKKKPGLAEALARVNAATTRPDGTERDPETESPKHAGPPPPPKPKG